jgi:hypothetical protein
VDDVSVDGLGSVDVFEELLELFERALFVFPFVWWRVLSGDGFVVAGEAVCILVVDAHLDLANLDRSGISQYL